MKSLNIVATRNRQNNRNHKTLIALFALFERFEYISQSYKSIVMFLRFHVLQRQNMYFSFQTIYMPDFVIQLTWLQNIIATELNCQLCHLYIYTTSTFVHLCFFFFFSLFLCKRILNYVSKIISFTLNFIYLIIVKMHYICCSA